MVLNIYLIYPRVNKVSFQQKLFAVALSWI